MNPPVDPAAVGQSTTVPLSGPPVFGVDSVPDVIYADIVASLPSLAGKCVAITGCTTGTGLHTARAAVARGAACVLLLNRKSSRADAADAELKAAAAEVTAAAALRVTTIDCDLQSFDGVRAAASQVNAIAAEHGGLDVLVNNAGRMGPDERTADGYDVQMQVNHLSHFLLTRLVISALEAAADARGEARVVQHSSAARGGRIALDGVGNLRREAFAVSDVGALGGNGFAATFDRYHQTKLANAAFAMALHFRLTAAGSKVKSLVAEPGFAATHFVTNYTDGHKEEDAGELMAFCKQVETFQSAADGACPLIMAAFSAAAGSGDFFAPKDDGRVGMPVKVLEGAAMAASCPEFISTKFKNEELTLHRPNHELLWEASEAAVGAW